MTRQFTATRGKSLGNGQHPKILWNVKNYHEETITKVSSTKTDCIVFSHKNDPLPKNIRAFGTNVKPSDSVKYRGVVLDCKLNFNKYVTHNSQGKEGALIPLLGKKS